MADQTLADFLQKQQQHIELQQQQIQHQQQLIQEQQQKFIEQQQQFNLQIIESISSRFQNLNFGYNIQKPESLLKGNLASSIQEFNYDPDEGLTFSAWYRRYEDIFLVEAENLDEAAKVRLLMQKLGAAEHTKYCNYILPKNPRDFNLQQTVNTLSSIFGERSSLFNIRYNCLKITHKTDEDIVTYVGRVNNECERFNLTELSNEQFKSLIFVAGLALPEEADIRTRLLSKLGSSKDLTIQELSEEYVRLQNLKNDTRMIQNAGYETETAAVERITRPSNFNPRRLKSTCWNCGQWHFSQYCPYKNHVCKMCGRVGHLERYCFRKGHRQSNLIQITKLQNYKSFRRYVTLKINGYDATLQIDTASDITIISYQTWLNIGSPALQTTNKKARNASGTTIPFIGEFICDFTLGEYYGNGTCYISKSKNLDLLGIEWINQLNLWNIPLDSVCHTQDIQQEIEYDVAIVGSYPNTDPTDLYEEFSDVFTERLGKCEKMVAELFVEPGVRPVFRPSRPVPYSMIELLDAELKRLEESEIISKVNYSAWAAPIVAVRKPNGSLRLCGDFSTGLNDALKTHEYPLPIPEDLFAKLNE